MDYSLEGRYSLRRYGISSSTGLGTMLLMITPRSSPKSCRATALASTPSITIKIMKRISTKRTGQIRTSSTG
jgi:hypothetical protein